jgi:GNAT superfamily N-acetyltransferase
VQKLFVMSSHRGQGISSRLLEELERYARSAGRTLLVLDTEQDSLAETVYRRFGWQRAGAIPGFALTPQGKLHATVYYYKSLAA